MPGDLVTAVPEIAPLNRVAVGQQHRIAGTVGNDRGDEFRHHIGPIQVEGDLAKAFRLALGTKHAPGLIEPLQGRVVLGLESHLGVKPELLAHGPLDTQNFAVVAVFAGLQRSAVDCQGADLQVGSVQFERGPGIDAVRIAAHVECRSHKRAFLAQLHGQLGAVDEKIRHLIVPKVDRAGLTVAVGHNGSVSFSSRSSRSPGRP